MSKWLSIVGPLLGLVLIAAWVTAWARRVPHEKALAAPPRAPYENSIAATGIVEASDRNYNLAPPVSGQLSALYVKENDIVHRDDKLYSIDDREQRTVVEQADANIAK